MAVLDLFEIEEIDHGDHLHRWLNFKDDARTEDLALLLAQAIARNQTSGVPGLYHRWEARRQGASSESPAGLKALLALVVGTPDAPKSANKIQAAVAEYLWFLIEDELQDALGGHDVYIAPPSLRVEDAGGDSLVMFRTASEELNARLWEVKKTVSTSGLRPTVTRACKQLSDEGYIYLAELASSLSKDSQLSQEEQRYAALLAVNWEERDSSLHVGVAVKAVRGNRKPDSFSRMAELIVDLDGQSRRVGVAIETGRFLQLADRVKEILWSGL